jgi:transcriptional regulator with XRE-family HTH domain
MASPIHHTQATSEAKRLRKEAGEWLKMLRKEAGLSQLDLANRLGLKYYTFVSQVENGAGRVPSDLVEAWAVAVNVHPAEFAKRLLGFYDPQTYRLLFGS